MSKTVTTLDQHSSVALPPEALDALGIEAGAELEVEIVGRALVVRPIDAETGGTQGLRDEALLESALTAAKNRHHYDTADVVRCAATYAFHLIQSHTFQDGNKRVAAAITEPFSKRTALY